MEDEYDEAPKRRRFTKESTIYGVFNDEEDFEEDRPQNLSKPMGFVSAGEKAASEDDFKPKKKQKMEAEPRENTFGFRAFKYSGKERHPMSTENDAFENSIGSKLLKGMGWTPGEGLGKEKQGINRPIEVKQRPKTRGLGFDNFDERTEQQKEDFPTEGDLEERAMRAPKEEMMPAGPREKGWKRQTKKVKRVYKLPTQQVDQLVQPAQKLVIKDMRGEEVRILSNITDVYKDESVSEFMPELQHNLRLLANMREANILSIDRKIITEKERLTKLGEHTESLKVVVEQEAERMKRLKELMEIIDRCNEKILAKQMNLESLAKVFLIFQKKFSDEYRDYNLHLLASALALPLLKDQLDSWKPLEKPEFAIEELATWKELTQKDEEYDLMDTMAITKRDQQEQVDIYTQLVCDLVLPKFRTCLTNEWNVRNPEPCLKLIEKWQPLLPQAVMENILEQLIFPKLSREADNWNPRLDTVPIHKWLHPWMALLGQRLQTVFPSIRHKLATVLEHWNAADTSAHVVLAPWKGVFDSEGMEALLKRSIIPKLHALMRGFAVDPRHQDISKFSAFMVWEDVIPINFLSDILEMEFFPKWHQVLYTWLSSYPNYQEVTAWYDGWKGQFSATMFAFDRIRAHFTHALHAMNNSANGVALTFQPPVFTAPAPAHKASPAPTPPTKQKEPDEMSFKEVVQHFAESHGLLLIPTGKRHEGQLIYNFGKVPITLGKEMVHKQEKGVWKVAGLEELLQQS